MTTFSARLDEDGQPVDIEPGETKPICLICDTTVDRGLSYLQAVEYLDKTDTGGHLFRGQEVGKWRLRGTIDRYWAIGKPADSTELVEAVRKKVNRAFREECIRHDYIKDTELAEATTPENEIEVEMLAQHYGLPTRLLDWSDNYNVGLFFAFGGWSSVKLDKPCVWRLDMEKFRQGAIEIRRRMGYLRVPDPDVIYEDYKQESTAVRVVGRADSKNRRVRKQRGVFTYSEDRSTPIESYISQHDSFPPATLTKILLRPEDQRHALRHLASAGTNAATVRADMDGVSVDMVNLFLRFDFGRD